MIELSILLITFNNENYIEETILSILNQNLNFKYEIVASDDCSKDTTFEILKEYKNKYPDLFKIIKNESQLGILKNFKATLDRCQGKYIFDLAGDDILSDKSALQIIVDALQKDEKLGFVDSGYDKLYEKHSKLEFFGNKNLINTSEDVYKEQILLGKTSTIGVCFNKNLLYKYVDFDTYIKMDITIDDYPILVDLIMNTNFRRINQSLHLYRIHDQSYSHSKCFEKQYFLANQMKNLFDYFSKKYNFENNIIESYNKTHLKQILFYAGFFENKELGKKVFLRITSKSIKDYIHYWASQNKFIRKLVSLI